MINKTQIFIIFYSKFDINLLTSTGSFDKILQDIQFKQDLKEVRNETQKEIKKAEENASVENPLYINPNGGPDLESKESKIEEGFTGQEKKLLLFFTQNCPHSQNFMPIWYRIQNRMPSYASAEQHDCHDHNSTELCRSYDITRVPTLILVHSGTSTVYNGAMQEDDITEFLRLHGINLSRDDFEGFVGNNTGDFPSGRLDELNLDNLDDQLKNMKKVDIDKRIDANEERIQKEHDDECPPVTFDKKLDRYDGIYSYQIFDENGVYGYSTGGKNQYLDKYHAAYNCFDSYLSSLPSENLMNKCAMKHRNQIRDFELCDPKKLEEIANYGNNIKNGTMKERIPNVDYDSNKKVVDVIKKACSL